MDYKTLVNKTLDNQRGYSYGYKKTDYLKNTKMFYFWSGSSYSVSSDPPDIVYDIEAKKVLKCYLKQGVLQCLNALEEKVNGTGRYTQLLDFVIYREGRSDDLMAYNNGKWDYAWDWFFLICPYDGKFTKVNLGDVLIQKKGIEIRIRETGDRVYFKPARLGGLKKCLFKDNDWTKIYSINNLIQYDVQPLTDANEITKLDINYIKKAVKGEMEE